MVYNKLEALNYSQKTASIPTVNSVYSYVSLLFIGRHTVERPDNIAA